MPSEINSVIRTRYTHVLNDDSSMSVYLLTVVENTFKSTIIPEIPPALNVCIRKNSH